MHVGNPSGHPALSLWRAAGESMYAAARAVAPDSFDPLAAHQHMSKAKLQSAMAIHLLKIEQENTKSLIDLLA